MKCFSKKLIAVILMFTIVIGLIMPLKLFAFSDTTAPSINSMSLDKNSINAPDKVKILLNVTDDISGVSDVRVFYYNPSRSQQLCAHMSEKSDNIWEGYLNFDKYVEEGTYTLWEIIATDAAGNQKDIYDTNLPSKFKSQTIKVVNAIGSDTTAPSINSMLLDKNSINTPDKVKISLNVTDDISGVSDVRVFYYNPSRSQQLCAHMSEKSDNIWEGYLNFDQYAEEGTYTLWEIIATDAAGNQKDIYDTNLPSKFKSQTIKVVNVIGSDTTAPSINSMSLDKNSINAPDKVKISLNVTDDISGVRDVRVFYYNPSRSQQLCAHMSEKSDNMWEGNLNFDKYVEEGTYTLWEIIATDAAGNQKDIYDTNLPSKFKSQTIRVVNSGAFVENTNGLEEKNNTVIVEDEKKEENNNISVSENSNSEEVKNNDGEISTNSEIVKTDDTISPSYEEKEVLTTGTKNETSLSNQKTENMGSIVWICLIAIVVLGIAGIVIYIKIKTIRRQ